MVYKQAPVSAVTKTLLRRHQQEQEQQQEQAPREEVKRSKYLVLPLQRHKIGAQP